MIGNGHGLAPARNGRRIALQVGAPAGAADPAPAPGPRVRVVEGPAAFEVTAERVSIQDRITQITERLRLSQQCTLASLLDQQPTVYDVVVTFLALLEMAKMRLVRVYQPDTLAEIFLESAVADAAPEEAAAELEGAVAEETTGESHEGSEPSDGA